MKVTTSSLNKWKAQLKHAHRALQWLHCDVNKHERSLMNELCGVMHAVVNLMWAEAAVSNLSVTNYSPNAPTLLVTNEVVLHVNYTKKLLDIYNTMYYIYHDKRKHGISQPPSLACSWGTPWCWPSLDLLTRLMIQQRCSHSTLLRVDAKPPSQLFCLKNLELSEYGSTDTEKCRWVDVDPTLCTTKLGSTFALYRDLTLVLAVWRRMKSSWEGQNTLGDASVVLDHCCSATALFNKWFNASTWLMRTYENSTCTWWECTQTAQLWQGQAKAPFITIRQFAQFCGEK